MPSSLFYSLLNLLFFLSPGQKEIFGTVFLFVRLAHKQKNLLIRLLILQTHHSDIVGLQIALGKSLYVRVDFLQHGLDGFDPGALNGF